MTALSLWPNALLSAVLVVWSILWLVLMFITCVGAGCVWPRVALLRSRTVAPAVLAALNGIGILGTFGAIAAFYHVLKITWVLPTVAVCFATGCIYLYRLWNERQNVRLTAFHRHMLLRTDDLKKALHKGKGHHPLLKATLAQDKLHILHKILFGFTVLLLIYLLTGALAPDSQQDSQWYHLSMARAWIIHGGFGAWPEVYPSSFTVFDCAVYAVSLVMTNDSVDCNLIQWLTGTLCVAICSLFAFEWFGRRGAAWAAFFSSSALASTAWFVPMHIADDLMVAAFMSAGLLLTIDELYGNPVIFGIRPQPARLFAKAKTNIPLDPWGLNRMACAGLFIGFAIVTKLTTLGWAVPAWLLLLFFATIRRNAPRLPWRHVFWTLGWAGVPWILWLLRNTFLGCGNPVYPLARKLIPLREGWELLGTRFASLNDIYPLSPAGLHAALQNLPAHLGGFFQESATPMIVIHAIAACVLINAIRLRKQHAFVLGALGFIGITQWGVLMWLRGTTELVRLFGQCMPITLVGAAGIAILLEDKLRHHRMLSVAATSIIALLIAATTTAKQWRWSNYPANCWSFRPVLTQSDRDTYLQKCPITKGRYNLWKQLNRTLPADACVLIAEGNYPFYLERKYYWCDEDITIPKVWASRQITRSQDIAYTLHNLKATHVVANRQELPAEWQAVLTPTDDPEVWKVN